VKEVTPSEANDLMKKEAYVYIDVRTEPEFANGHAEGALNIPVFLPGPGGMAPNTDFLTTVRGLFAPGQKMVVGCQMGGRSSRACQILEQAGFQNVKNVRGGFGGARDPSGRVIEKGWADLALPVSKDTSDSVSYQGLKKKAAQKK
jgi:rhodanese-related sulfurtransferase